MSMTIAELFERFSPDGTVSSVSLFPYKSVIELVKLEMPKSAAVTFDPTV